MIGIVTVYYNQPQFLRLYFESLAGQSLKDYSIYFIDNSPYGEGKEFIDQLYSIDPVRIKYLKQDSNTGYAAGTNIGARQAISDGCKYLFILNPDVELHKDCIRELFQLIESNGSIVCTGPIILRHQNGDGDIIQEYGGNINFRNGTVEKYYANKPWVDQDYPVILESGFVSGGACFIRSDILQNAGMLEENYFAYFDEIDLYYRMRKLANSKMYVTSKAILWHNHDWSPRNPRAYYTEYYLSERNKFLFFYKFGMYWNLLLGVIIDIIKFPVRLFWFKKVCNFRLGYYYLRGLVHGVLRISGKPPFTAQ